MPYFGKNNPPSQTEPLTFQEAMLNTLASKGLTADEADACYAASLPRLHEHTQKMMGEKIATYPPHTIMWGLWIGLRGYSLDWIEANRPELRERFLRD